MESRTYTFAPHGKVCTQVDPEGLETVLEFDLEGRLETSDPGVIAVLDRLADDPASLMKREEKKAPRTKTPDPED